MALYLVLLAGFAVGVWGSYRAVFPARGLYRMTAVFQDRATERLFLVRHEDVPGLMGGMETMAVTVESPETLDRAGLARGDRIRLTVRQQGPDLVAVEIEKIR